MEDQPDEHPPCPRGGMPVGDAEPPSDLHGAELLDCDPLGDIVQLLLGVLAQRGQGGLVPLTVKQSPLRRAGGLPAINPIAPPLNRGNRSCLREIPVNPQKTRGSLFRRAQRPSPHQAINGISPAPEHPAAAILRYSVLDLDGAGVPMFGTEGSLRQICFRVYNAASTALIPTTSCS